MHSTTGPSGLTYHHNGDYSGDVKVTIPLERHKTRPWGTTTTKFDIDERIRQVTVDIPFEDMRWLVLRYLQSKLISRLEDANDDELEQLLLGFKEN